MTSIRILVADGSAVARREISQMLGADPELDVVAIASTGQLTLERVGQLLPDVLVLELAMPDVSGLDVLKALRKQVPHLPVLVFSTLTESTGNITLDALALGASDYITKPTSPGARLPGAGPGDADHQDQGAVRAQPAEHPAGAACAGGTSWPRFLSGSLGWAWWWWARPRAGPTC